MAKKTIPTITSKKAVSEKKHEVVSASKFSGEVLAEGIIGQLIVDLQHNLHRSTAHTKTRGEVQGTTRKPWRQKGTGRARVGTRRTPVWRGGGRVFGPRTERNFIRKINKKLINPALITVLQKKSENGDIFTMSQAIPPISKTSEVIKIFKGVLDAKSNLVIMPEGNVEFERAVKNIKYITLRQVNHLNLLDIVKARHVIFTADTIDKLIKKLS